MNESNDAQLLAQFAQNACEEAFAELVRRHIHLVHSVALRHVSNPSHAQEIAQTVFLILARKAGGLGEKTIVSGWLYHTARLTALNFQRMEQRRRRREQEAFMQQTTLEETSKATVWKDLSPFLEEAMAGLGATDRDAIVLRYFENKTLHQTAAALGLEERAAQKRVARALEKLRSVFLRRGVSASTSTALIAGAISTYSVQASPPALVSTISAAALQGTAVTGSSLTLIQETLKLMAWTKTKITTVSAAVLLLAAGTTTLWVKPAAGRGGSQPLSRSVQERIKAVNTGLPEAQVQGKMFIFTAMGQNKIPDAINWCDTLNVGGKLWPVTPTNTLFAINSQVAGRAYSRKEMSSGAIPGDTVVFFETGQAGWNQSGGPELASQNATGLAVVLANGSSLIVAPAELAKLRWKP